MSEAMRPDQSAHHGELLGEASSESLNRPLRPLDDSSLGNNELQTRLDEHLMMRQVMQAEEPHLRARHLLNEILTAIDIIRPIAELHDKHRQDASETLRVQQLIAAAESRLAQAEQTDTVRALTSELFDIYDRFENTNLVRATEILDRKHKKYAADIVQVKRLSLIMLDDQQQ